MLSSSSRLLRVLSLLQTRSHWAGPELAERLAVHPRTLRRDIDRLRQLGYPIHASSGVAGGYAFYIGDVSGPNRPRLQDLGPKLRATPDKIPNNPSRVLSAWAGILETGRAHADFRMRRAAAGWRSP